MSTLEQIEAAILTLPSDEFQRLRQWFFDLDYQRWDEQLQQDIEDGKLEALAEEAIADFKSGQQWRGQTRDTALRFGHICRR